MISNSLKKIFYTPRYHSKDWNEYIQRIDGLQNTSRNSHINILKETIEKLEYTDAQIGGILAKTSICSKSIRCQRCTRFQVEQRIREREVNELVDKLDLSKRMASKAFKERKIINNNKSVIGHLQRLCQENNVEFVDFLSS